MLIDEDGTKLGDMGHSQAESIAKEKGRSLKLVDKTKQVYRIVDRGKFNYDQKRKARKRLAQQRAQKVKEIQIRPTIDDGDLEIKVKRVRGFLEKGLKTKIIMKFKKQQLIYKDVGMKKIVEIINDILESGLATLDSSPKFEGRGITVFLSPIK